MLASANNFARCSNLLLVVVFALALCGCRSKSDSGSSGESASGPKTTISAHGLEISDSSSPAEVTDMLMAALAADDRDTLGKLVAIEKARADLMRITKGKDRFAGMVERAGETTVAGWLLTFGFIDPESTKVDPGTEKISGDKATITVHAKLNDGSPTLLIVELARENGMWKVVPGLNQR